MPEETQDVKKHFFLIMDVPEERRHALFLGAAFSLTVMGHFVECGKCKRKILVELPLIGVPHHTNVQVTCADCLVVSDAFKAEYPEEAKQIEEWLTQ